MTHYDDMDFVSSLRCHYCQRKIAMHYKAKLKMAGGMVATLKRELARIQSMEIDEFALYQHNNKYRSEK